MFCFTYFLWNEVTRVEKQSNNRASAMLHKQQWKSINNEVSKFFCHNIGQGMKACLAFLNRAIGSFSIHQDTCTVIFTRQLLGFIIALHSCDYLGRIHKSRMGIKFQIFWFKWHKCFQQRNFYFYILNHYLPWLKLVQAPRIFNYWNQLFGWTWMWSSVQPYPNPFSSHFHEARWVQTASAHSIIFEI